VVLRFRWHPRWRLRGAGVAPVRGGTYFLCGGAAAKKVTAAPHSNALNLSLYTGHCPCKLGCITTQSINGMNAKNTLLPAFG
jgi:hypothetical protein